MTSHSSSAVPPALAELRSFPPPRVLLVAIDIGKDVHVLTFRSLSGDVLLPPSPFSSLACGFERFAALLDLHLASRQFDLVLLGHEPTGVYHEAWQAAILNRFSSHLSGQSSPPLRYRLLTPALVKQQRQHSSHRRRKTDAIDAQAIAILLADGLGNPIALLDPPAQLLRLALGHMRRLERRQHLLASDLLRCIDRLWPGALGDHKRYARAHPDLPELLHLVDSRPLERTRLRLLLEHCPDPHQLRALGAEGICELFHHHGQRCGPLTAQRILAVLNQSLLPPPDISAVLAAQLHEQFALYCAYERQIDAAQAQALELLPQSSANVLTSVPGVSAVLAARYLAAIGDVVRFSSARQIWAFAGFDLNVSDSGNRRSNGTISHSGSPYLRSTLYQIGFLASQHCPELIALHHQARARGLSQVEATIHVANKLNRLSFAMLHTQQPYRSPLSAEQDAYWLAQTAAARKRSAKAVQEQE